MSKIGFSPPARPGEGKRCVGRRILRRPVYSVENLFLLLRSLRLCDEPDGYVFFFPNSGSIFTRPVTMNPGIVAAMTQRK